MAKYDYPPLLAPGRHVMELNEIERRFVHPFKGGQKRQRLYRELEELVAALGRTGLRCEIWVDGSFLTEKADPRDLDVTVIIDPDVGVNLTQAQRSLIDQANNGGFGADVDSFAFIRLRADDPMYKDELEDPAYSWSEQYLLECGAQWLKGFVVIKLGETHVGLLPHR